MSEAALGLCFASSTADPLTPSQACMQEQPEDEAVLRLSCVALLQVHLPLLPPLLLLSLPCWLLLSPLGSS